jgi:hypothetical protein
MNITTRVLNAQPWRFAPGDVAYVRGWPEASTVEIIAQLLNPTWPHYLAVDLHGNTWRLPQIHLSRSPITDR